MYYKRGALSLLIRRPAVNGEFNWESMTMRFVSRSGSELCISDDDHRPLAWIVRKRAQRRWAILTIACWTSNEDRPSNIHFLAQSQPINTFKPHIAR